MTDPEQGSPSPEAPEPTEATEPTESPAGPGRRSLRPPGARRRVAIPTADEEAARAERRTGGPASRVRALLPERLERPATTTLLAIGLPVLTLLVGVLADARVDDGLGAHAPSTAALVRTSQICPVPPSAGGRVLVASDTEAGGRVAVRSAGVGVRSTPLTVRPQRVAERSAGSRPTIVTGEDAVAPGLQVTGVSGGRLAAASCPTPSADVWFTGVGADATHRSILELTSSNNALILFYLMKRFLSTFLLRKGSSLSFWVQKTLTPF